MEQNWIRLTTKHAVLHLSGTLSGISRFPKVMMAKWGNCLPSCSIMSLGAGFTYIGFSSAWKIFNARFALQWHHNERDGVSNHQRRNCLLNRLFGRRSKKTSKLRVTGLCEGNSPETGEFPAQKASNAENGSIWWRHHLALIPYLCGM